MHLLRRMQTTQSKSARGFSLIEALIASVIVGSALVALAHLVAAGAEQALNSRRATSALTIAQSKLEHLRRVAWTFAPDGSRVSSALLAASPAESLDEDAAGYVDALDAFGETVSRDGSDVEFMRRWSISPLTPGDRDTLLIQVCVFAIRRADAPGKTPDACVAAIRTRQP